MLYGIISDIHGNEVLLEKALTALRNSSAGKIVCLGDIIGKSGNSVKCLDLLFDADALLVSGNHDKLSINDLPEQYRKRLKAKIKNAIREDNLLFAHTATCRNAFYGIEPWDEDNKIDSLKKAEDQFRQEQFFIFFYGHRHEARVFELDEKGMITSIEKPAELLLSPSKRYLCNPGPITTTKDIDIENPHRKGIIKAIPSFARYDSETKRITYTFLDAK